VLLACPCLVAVVASAQCRWEAPSGSLRIGNAVWTGSRFVAVGRDASGQLVATSATGIDWTVVLRFSLPSLPMLAWDGRQFLALIPGQAWRGVDAATWIEVPTDFGYLEPRFFTFAADRFFAFEPPLWWGAGELWASQDGEHWSIVQQPRLGDVFRVIYTGSLFVAIGGPNPWVDTSPDAVSWSAQSLPPEAGAFPYLYDVAWNGRAVVAGGKDGLIVTSLDGLVWSVQSSGVSASLYAVAATSDGFVCGGEGGTVLTSADGALWRPETVPTQSTIVSLVAAGTRTLAVTSDGSVLVRTCEPVHRLSRHLGHSP
jgi:hypothetical protein